MEKFISLIATMVARNQQSRGEILTQIALVCVLGSILVFCIYFFITLLRSIKNKILNCLTTALISVLNLPRRIFTLLFVLTFVEVS